MSKNDEGMVNLDMHAIDIHVFWQKYTHTDTHTQTRNTCAYTYPSTQSSHRHTKKHKTPTYMHQQAQTHTCAHTPYMQQTYKNTKLH